MKKVPCLVYTVEEIIANASRRVGENMAAFCDDVKLMHEYCDIVADIQRVINSIENKCLRKEVTGNLIGLCGPSYYFIPEVDECSRVPFCVIEYPDGEQYGVEFFA